MILMAYPVCTEKGVYCEKVFLDFYLYDPDFYRVLHGGTRTE